MEWNPWIFPVKAQFSLGKLKLLTQRKEKNLFVFAISWNDAIFLLWQNVKSASWILCPGNVFFPLECHALVHHIMTHTLMQDSVCVDSKSRWVFKKRVWKSKLVFKCILPSFLFSLHAPLMHLKASKFSSTCQRENEFPLCIKSKCFLEKISFSLLNRQLVQGFIPPLTHDIWDRLQQTPRTLRS